MSTHALSTSDGSAGLGLRVLRNLDLGVLAVALPIFLAAGLPLLGWGATAVAWVASRVVQTFAERRAATLMARLYLVGLTVLAAGIIEREAGLTAGILAVVVFTVYFAALFIVKPLEEARR